MGSVGVKERGEYAEGNTRIPGRSGRFRKGRAVGTSEVLKTERGPKVCQKSDYLIVAKKRVKARGAKGMTNQRFSSAKHAWHRRLQKAWNKS